jgi:DNA-binding MarR family transcriptional regulator
MAKREYAPDELVDAWIVLRQTRDAIMRNMDADVLDGSVSASGMQLLFALNRAERPVSQRDLTHYLFRRGHSMSGLVDRMVNNGLISRERDTVDRRIVNVSVTQKGEDVFDAAHPKINKTVTDIFSALSDSELSMLTSLLWKLRVAAMKRANVPNEIVDKLSKPWDR